MPSSETTHLPPHLPTCVTCVLSPQTKTKHEIEAERRELARQLEKRTQELEHLTGEDLLTHLTGSRLEAGGCVLHCCVSLEDVRLLKERLAESNRVKMEVQLKLDEIQSSEASIQVPSAHTTHRT